MASNHFSVFASCVFVFGCCCGQVCAQEVHYEDVDPDASGVLLQVKKAKTTLVTQALEPEVKTGNSFNLPFTTVAFNMPSGREVVSRGYGAIPGPTLRWTPGNEIEVTLDNLLTEPNPGCHDATDNICYLNTTNFHTHGLHVSSAEPQDNVFHLIEPGQSYTYTYSLRPDHMGGTHWYHPHAHHATSTQAGGGAHGMLIVEDLPGSLPDIVANAPEIVLVISMLNVQFASHSNHHNEGEDTIMKFHPDAQDACLINGNFQPSFKIEAGKWTRLRMLYAAIERTLHIPAPDGCEFGLIAKDGIYLSVAPRNIGKVELAPGNRADVMVKCSAEGVASVNTFGMSVAHGQGFTLAETYNAKLLDLDVQASTGGADPPIDSFKTNRPCYLADLRGAPVAESHRLGLHPEANELTPGFFGQYKALGPGGFFKAFHVSFDGEGKSWPKHGEHYHPPPSAVFKLGEVQEWVVGGLQIHPLHVHVGPFQVTNGTGNAPGSGGYYEDGDWHDTYLANNNDIGTIRFAPDTYAGDYVLHCHLLSHEDFGMMTYFQAEGTEGTVWAGAEAADPTCYRPENINAGFT